MSARLTQADRRTIAFALNCAIEERDSFADAYSNTGPEAEAALASVAKFKALHMKMFGTISAVEQFAAKIAALPSVSLIDLAARKPQP